MEKEAKEVNWDEAKAATGGKTQKYGAGWLKGGCNWRAAAPFVFSTPRVGFFLLARRRPNPRLSVNWYLCFLVPISLLPFSLTLLAPEGSHATSRASGAYLASPKAALYLGGHRKHVAPRRKSKCSRNRHARLWRLWRGFPSCLVPTFFHEYSELES